MNTRTKFTNIPKKVKQKVYERDSGCCIVCGIGVTEEMACAHVVPRSAGGLGVEENIVTLCNTCHMLYDQSTKRNELLFIIMKVIKRSYPDWSREKVTYKKGVTHEKS